MPPRTHPDPEVVPSAKRRRYSTKEKLGILADADRCTEPGQIGELLRKKGIYSSHLARWRALLKKSGRDGFADHKRGRKPDPSADLKALMLENQKLQARLARAELIIDVQKKVSALLGLPTPSDESSS
jgi:transposase